jgi:hypothetical protein
MSELRDAFLTKAFLHSNWAIDYEAFKGSEEEHQLLERLERWATRKDLREKSAEPALLEEFFRQTWNYVQTGQLGAEDNFTLWPKFPVPGAGPKGGVGEADAAMGYFSKDGSTNVPQVLCEFKDIKSDLDAPQRRKGSTRSPVRQCLDYLGFARRGMFGNEPILPTWGIVTDMNEFRLYWFDRGHHQFLQFTIRPTTLFQGPGLLVRSEAARFDRFLFKRLLDRNTLLSRGGRSLLAQLIATQWVRQRDLENEFYAEYRNFRDHLYQALLTHNGEGTSRFPGTKGRLVRLAQKILDRCLFIFYCEDMGRTLGFPPQLLRDLLKHDSDDRFFDPESQTIWQRLLGLFRAMNEGSTFGEETLNQFNGGLFAEDQAIERLHVPNRVFCEKGQGQNEATLHQNKRTLLYLSATYNYAGESADWVAAEITANRKEAEENRKSLGLYTLGRIFEQSITELEILEAEADGRLSVNKLSKRKTDGVYYTPEWVVDRIVGFTLGPLTSELKRESGWPDEETGKLPTKEAIDAYMGRLTALKVVDPACGSGAFLITALRFLFDEWRAVRALRRQVTREYTAEEWREVGAIRRQVPEDYKPDKSDDLDQIVRDILRSNLYGVDINAASVEIAQLALWLHTARAKKPLSSLEKTIRCGNSLVDSDFYKGQINLGLYGDVERERVNAFDWDEAFPEVFEHGGFDAVISNPPYVKLQNFRRVHADVVDFIRNGRPSVHINGYKSAQTGNFDLYLPFIERGLSLLNERGRLGYIAPSLWTVNEYGEGLRSLIGQRRQLARWLDFKAFQVFEEATNYTALQFFTKAPNEAISVAFAPDGVIPVFPWGDPKLALPYQEQVFGERWLLLTGEERDLINRFYKRYKRLDNPAHTTTIYQGLITSADAIYHLKRLGPRRYLCSPKGKNPHPPYEVEIEDEIMKPLVSGSEAKRYVEPITDTYLLFPYRTNGRRVELIDAGKMATSYPKAWTYLQSYEAILRRRESESNQDKGEANDQEADGTDRPFDNDAWYRFGRHQNLDKQETVKLIVPRLVASLGCSVDENGTYYLDNVDVGGIAIAENEDPFFLAGVLNSPVAQFVFRRISKPFRGDYLSANKQFIAPLPVATADAKQRSEIAKHAQELQRAHTKRRDLILNIGRRLTTMRRKSRPETWLFSTLKSRDQRFEETSTTLSHDTRKKLARDRFEEDLEARYGAITDRLHPGAALDAQFSDGELSLTIDGSPVIDRIFLHEQEGKLVLAQWKVLASTFSITETTDGKRLCNVLRKLALPDNPTAVTQLVVLAAELSDLEIQIHELEVKANDLIYSLYELTGSERALVESETKR